MKEKYNLTLTKAQAKQLYNYMFLAEDAEITPKPTNKFWERHEVLVDKLHAIIYQDGKTTENSEQSQKT